VLRRLSAADGWLNLFRAGNAELQGVRAGAYLVIADHEFDRTAEVASELDGLARRMAADLNLSPSAGDVRVYMAIRRPAAGGRISPGSNNSTSSRAGSNPEHPGLSPPGSRAPPPGDVPAVRTRPAPRCHTSPAFQGRSPHTYPGVRHFKFQFLRAIDTRDLLARVRKN
jgi:hypothetical protein